MGTRPTAKQPPASAYRAVGAELSDKTMDEKGIYLHDKYTEIESLVKIGQYYREQAYGGYGLTQYRQDNAAMFDAYEQEYTDKTYTLCSTLRVSLETEGNGQSHPFAPWSKCKKRSRREHLRLRFDSFSKLRYHSTPYCCLNKSATMFCF